MNTTTDAAGGGNGVVFKVGKKTGEINDGAEHISNRVPGVIPNTAGAEPLPCIGTGAEKKTCKQPQKDPHLPVDYNVGRGELRCSGKETEQGWTQKRGPLEGCESEGTGRGGGCVLGKKNPYPKNNEPRPVFSLKIMAFLGSGEGQ